MTDWAAQIWRRQAVCAQLTGWHQATTEEQRDVCSTCPVSQECLIDALTEHTAGGYPYGMRGGLTEDERVARLTGRPLRGWYHRHRQHLRRREPCTDECQLALRAAKERKAAS